MATDITATDNYATLSAPNKVLVGTCVTAIKAAFAGVPNAQKDNIYMLLREQIESQEET